MDIVFMACQHAKLCLYGASVDAVGTVVMGKVSNLLRFRNICLKVFLRSVNHNVRKAGHNRLLNLFQICCVVQVKAEGHLRISLRDSFCSLRDQLQRTYVLDCSEGSHQNHRRVLFSCALHDADHLRNRAEIKCSNCVSVLRLSVCRCGKSDRVSHNLLHC